MSKIQTEKELRDLIKEMSEIAAKARKSLDIGEYRKALDKISAVKLPKLKANTSLEKKPFQTAYIFGSEDVPLADKRKWKQLQNDPSYFSFATEAELDAFREGVEAAEGWLDSHELDKKEQKACERARKNL